MHKLYTERALHRKNLYTNRIGDRMLDDSTWEQPLVIYTRARLDRKDSSLSLSNIHKSYTRGIAT